MKNKICFIAQFPPPVHGLSKAVDTLYNSHLKDKYIFEKIDITDNKKFLSNLFKIVKSSSDLFYFTISQSKFGNIRDLIILKIINLKKKKCLIHLHGGYYGKLVKNDLSKFQRKLNYNAMKKVSGVIVLGESLKDNFEGMIPEDKIFVVPNCVDDEYLMDNASFYKKLELSNSKEIKHILYLSNFIKEKGYMDVLQLALLEKNNNDTKFHFDFAGKFFSQEAEDEFFEFIKDNDLDDYVTYHGIVTGNKKMDLLNKSDIFILLTNYPKEGQPISIIEAMGNGLLVVTTKHAGIPDIVKNKKNGLIFDKDYKIDYIYNKMYSLDDESYKKYCKKAYSSVTLEYNEKKYIQNMENLYDNILNKKD